MTESLETREIVDERQLENARVGYQVAASLRTSRAEELWSQFNAFVTANSIILTAAVIAISSPQPTPVLSIGMPVVGLVLCALWLMLHARGVGYVRYYLLSARELEEQFLSDSVRTLSRGGHLAEGEKIELLLDGEHKPRRMNFFGQILRVRTVAYLVIMVFAVMYLAILVWG